MDKVFYFVYRSTLRETGEFYIGAHRSRIDPRIEDDRYRGSGGRISSLVRQLGWWAFDREVLCMLPNETELMYSEKDEVKKHIKNEKCLNQTGGGGFKCELNEAKARAKIQYSNQDSRLAASSSMKKYFSDPDNRKKRSIQIRIAPIMRELKACYEFKALYESEQSADVRRYERVLRSIANCEKKLTGLGVTMKE